MAKHTPGPWEIETDHDEGENVVLIHGAADAPGLISVATVFTVEAFPETDDEDHENMRIEYESNARLIAAAPDLWAACQEVERVLSIRNTDNTWEARLLDIVRAAMDKALKEG